MKEVTIHPTLNPFAFKTVRQYRGVSKTKLCKDIKGLLSKDITAFENGNLTAMSLDELKASMNVLDWPFDFLYSNITPVTKTSLNLKQ